MSWSELTEWWRSEVESDPAYDEVVTPGLLEILLPEPGDLYVDLGCGEGRVARAVRRAGARVVGLDMNEQLVDLCEMPAAVADIEMVPIRDNLCGGAYAVLVLEHLVSHERFFAETSRIVRAGGTLAIVSNHPMWTATGSTPVQDTDGELLWRPGSYFSEGSTEIEVSGGTVKFHHRSMSDLLNAAAHAGWALEMMIERPHHGFEDQSGIPRLLACRWRLLP